MNPLVKCSKINKIWLKSVKIGHKLFRKNSGCTSNRVIKSKSLETYYCVTSRINYHALQRMQNIDMVYIKCHYFWVIKSNWKMFFFHLSVGSLTELIVLSQNQTWFLSSTIITVFVLKKFVLVFIWNSILNKLSFLLISVGLSILLKDKKTDHFHHKSEKCTYQQIFLTALVLLIDTCQILFCQEPNKYLLVKTGNLHTKLLIKKCNSLNWLFCCWQTRKFINDLPCSVVLPFRQHRNKYWW